MHPTTHLPTRRLARAAATTAVIVALASVLCLAAIVVAARLEPAPQNATGQEASGDEMPGTDQMMQAWMKLNAPGEAHERLLAMTGTWDSTVKHWMLPGTEPTVSTLTVTYEPMLGGRYLEGRHVGTMNMGPEPIDFEGIEITGYDNFREEYVSMWMDSLSTAIMTTRGTWDEDAQRMVMRGTMDDPLQGARDLPVRSIMTVVDENTTRYEMYGPAPDGTMFRSMEIVSKRRGGPSSRPNR